MGVGGKLRREGTYVCLQLNHFALQQKRTQHTKSKYTPIKSTFFLMVYICRDCNLATDFTTASDGDMACGNCIQEFNNFVIQQQ